jgi:hypothetical protein
MRAKTGKASICHTDIMKKDKERGRGGVSITTGTADFYVVFFTWVYLIINFAAGCQYTLAEPVCQKQQQVNLTFYL